MTKKEDLKIIALNGMLLLGQITESPDRNVIMDSLALEGVSVVTKRELIQYIKAEYQGKLIKQIDIIGQATLAVSVLPNDLMLEYDILLLRFSQAEAMAPTKLVCSEFDQLVK